MKKILLLCFIAAMAASCNSNTDYDVFASVYGFVSDTDTGEPIANANVLLSPGGYTKLTGSDGWFEFNELEPQQYTVTVQKAGYSTNRKSVNTVAGTETEVNITITKN